MNENFWQIFYHILKYNDYNELRFGYLYVANPKDNNERIKQDRKNFTMAAFGSLMYIHF